jgi:hypothetical protein
MKKLLSAFILVFVLYSVGYGQNPISKEYLKGTKGKPTFISQAVGAYCPDYEAKQVWRALSKTVANWTLETDTNIIYRYFPKVVNGKDGKDGRDGQSIVGPQGPQGPVGPQGPPGPAGGGGSGTSRIITSHLIEEAGAIVIGGSNSTKTVQEAGYSSANYPGYNISNSDQFDWANLQYAMYLEWQTGKKYQTYGTFRGIPKMVDLGANNYYLDFDGTFAFFYTSNNNAFAVFGRPTPANMTEANLQIQAMYDIENINIFAQSNQIGLQPQPTYTSTFKGINVTGAKTGMWLQFNLNAEVKSCMLTNCTNGLLFDMLDPAKTSGATNANSQSNHSSAHHIRVYGNGEIAFGSIASSGTSFIDCIVEGFKYKYPYYVDGKNSTVVKNWKGETIHYEGINGVGNCGSGEAMFKIRLLGGTVVINDIFAQYAGCVVDAAGTAAAVVVHIEKSNWVVTPSDGKLFYNGGTTQWHFDWNTIGDIMNPNTISSRFAGTPVNQCGGWACGNNKWQIDGMGVTGVTAGAARGAAGQEGKYTVTLKFDMAKFMNFHPYLRSKIMEENLGLGNHVYKVETLEVANEIVAANPDFIGTIEVN